MNVAQGLAQALALCYGRRIGGPQALARKLAEFEYCASICIWPS